MDVPSVTAPSPAQSDTTAAGETSTRTAGHAPLRTGMLQGEHTQRGWDFQDFETFLRDDAQALPLWLGQHDLQQIAHTAPNAPRFREALRSRIDRDIACIDATLSRQIDAILHHPSFQKLEGSWRGLQWLVANVEPQSRVIVRIMPARMRDLARDLERALEFDQSTFFKLIYENEFGHAGGQPFGLLVADYEFAHRPAARRPLRAPPPDDIMVLKRFASIAAAAFVPLIISASPRLFDVDQFSDLTLSRDVSAVLSNAEHKRWSGIAHQEDTRFLCIALPRILARPRWTRATTRGRHEEYTPTESERCWFAAGYALARNVVRAQSNFRWPADIRGVTPGEDVGGVVLDMPREDFTFGATTTLQRASTELGFTDQQERTLATTGFMPLNTIPYGEAAFTSVSSMQAQAPVGPGTPTAAAANRKLSSEINGLLCVCRFAHYIKMLGRDMIGSTARPDEVQRALQDWLNRFCNASTTNSRENRARFPLRSSQVAVSVLEGRPGEYHCVVHLQPHYQLDDVSTTFRLVTNIASNGGAPGGIPLTTLRKD